MIQSYLEVQLKTKIYMSNMLALRRPIGLPLTRALRRKLRITADSSLTRQKIGTFFIENDVIKGWLILIIIVFSLQSHSFAYAINPLTQNMILI